MSMIKYVVEEYVLTGDCYEGKYVYEASSLEDARDVYYAYSENLHDSMLREYAQMNSGERNSCLRVSYGYSLISIPVDDDGDEDIEHQEIVDNIEISFKQIKEGK